MKFEVGDKIRVRKDLVIGNRYGEYWFSKNMKDYLGKDAIITKISYNDSYQLDVDNESYCWTDEMLEEIPQESTQQTQEREYQTGDIVFAKDKYNKGKEIIGIVYGDRINYLTGGKWGFLEEDREAITRFIPVENIKEAKYPYKISQLLEEKMMIPLLEPYIVQVKKQENTKVYQVEFTPNSPTLHNFIAENKEDIINVDDIVLCHQGNTIANTWQYCKVKNIVEKELNESDLDNYRKCKSIK